MEHPREIEDPEQVEKHAARAALRRALLRAHEALSWNEIVRVLAECPSDDPEPDGKADGHEDGKAEDSKA